MHLVFVDNMVLTNRRNLAELDVHPHLGLISLAAVVQRDGHQVTIYDPKRAVRFGELAYDDSLYEQVASVLLATGPDAIGFTTLGCSFIFVLRVAGYLKKAEPDLPILLGGPHATILHREIMERFPSFDVVVRHEAEDTVPALLDNLDRRSFEDVPGVTWRARQFGVEIRSSAGSPMIKDLDSLPIPAYNLYPVPELGLTMMRIEAGRGCPFSCSFCSTATFFQRRYRLKSPGRIIEEMDLLKARYGVTDFKLDHDMFTANRKAVLAFCRAIEGHGYTWNVSSRVDCVDAELLEAMSRAGCSELYFGVETGSQTMQRLVKKRMDLAQLEPTLEVTERLGINTTVSLITGFPEERAEDMNATLDLVGRCFCRPEQPSLTQLHILLPEPGTELYSKLGDKLRYDGYRTDFNAWLLETEDEALILSHPEIFATYYHYPTTLPRERHTFAVEATRALFALGPTLLTYFLRYYDSRFSVLVSRLWVWAEKHGRVVDATLVRDFVVDEFGPGRHVASLVRYVTSTAAISGPDRDERKDDGARLLGVEPHKFYELSRHAVLFEDIHDCPALLAHIAEFRDGEGPMPEAETGERSCYLAVGSSRDDGAFVNYPIDPGLYALLSLFETPRRLDQVSSFISTLSDEDALDPRLVEDLVRIGALVPARNDGRPTVQVGRLA